MLRSFVSGAVALAMSAGIAVAEWKPADTITMMVMFPPGGGGDVLARTVAKTIEEKEGWNIVVDNKFGGGGAAMAKLLKEADPDGLTIGMAVSETFSFVPVMNAAVGYTVDDFTVLGSIADTQIGWVAPTASPYGTFEDLIKAAKDGEEIEVGAFSPRATAAIMALNKQFGVEFIPVPVKSGQEGVQNVLSGHLQTTLAAGPQAPHVRTGDLKVLASLEDERLTVGGDAKTLEESGAGIATFNVKWAFAAPAGLPDEVRAAWTEALAGLQDSEELRSFIEDKMSLKMVYTPGDDLRQLIVDGRAANETLVGFLRN